MTQKGFFIDVSKCTGCRTCQVACSDLNNTPVGVHLRRVLEVEGGSWKKTPEGLWKQDVFAYYVSLGCNQCSDPACVKVCPTKAHFKRKGDGLVVIDRAKCVGCGMCAQACPYGVPKLDAQARKMLKCDGCLERTQKGLEPVCVESCPERAIEFGDIEALRRKHGTTAAVAPLPSADKTHPNLVIKAPAHAQQSATPVTVRGA